MAKALIEFRLPTDVPSLCEQTAVCAVELWPEARKCREDGRLFQGIAAGVLIMAGTLAIGV